MTVSLSQPSGPRMVAAAARPKGKGRDFEFGAIVALKYPRQQMRDRVVAEIGGEITKPNFVMRICPAFP